MNTLKDKLMQQYNVGLKIRMILIPKETSRASLYDTSKEFASSVLISNGNFSLILIWIVVIQSPE